MTHPEGADQTTEATCPFCTAGRLREGTTTLTSERRDEAPNLYVIVEHVPALVCQSCGEAILDTEVSKRATQLARQARHRLFRELTDRLQEHANEVLPLKEERTAPTLAVEEYPETSFLEALSEFPRSTVVRYRENLKDAGDQSYAMAE